MYPVFLEKKNGQEVLHATMPGPPTRSILKTIEKQVGCPVISRWYEFTQCLGEYMPELKEIRSDRDE